MNEERPGCRSLLIKLAKKLLLPHPLNYRQHSPAAVLKENVNPSALPSMAIHGKRDARAYRHTKQLKSQISSHFNSQHFSKIEKSVEKN